MSVIKELHQLTEGLLYHLEKQLPKDEGREEYIEGIDSFLEKRQKLLDQLTRPEGAEESRLAAELIEMNKTVNIKLSAVQSRIRSDINQLKKRKNTGKKYENPYNGPTADGVFFDSKK